MTKSNRVNVYLTDDMRNSIKEQAEKVGGNGGRKKNVY